MGEGGTMEKQLFEALEHILNALDWESHASDSEVMDAIDWAYIRATVEEAKKDEDK